MGELGGMAAVLALSFLSGSIPSAYLAGRLAGKGDIRTRGSGNPGATNAYRILGARWAVPVVIVDFFKGFAPVALTVGGDAWLSSPRLAVLAGGAAVLGHVFSPWLSFRGGKGVATGAGAFTALMPLLFPICLAVFVAALVVSRRASVASLYAALTLPIVFFALTLAAGERVDPVVATVVVSVPVVVCIAHAKNIARLRDGTESRLF